MHGEKITLVYKHISVTNVKRRELLCVGGIYITFISLQTDRVFLELLHQVKVHILVRW